jgi:glycosyltransferase involved in cell wall biosynthesis
MSLRLLYFCPATEGGIANYAHAQATAIAAHGVEVVFLTAPAYRPLDLPPTYHLDPSLPGLRPLPLSSKVRLGLRILEEQRALRRAIATYQIGHVLFATYSEYLAPLWWQPLAQFARQGIRFGAIVHDPCRTYQVGPRWWHRWSIACGYGFLQEAFVHEPIHLDTVQPMPQLHTTVIPHGSYRVPSPQKTRDACRRLYQIPEASTLLLSFGQIRDNKNLDLVLRAIAQVPEVYLLIAGRVASETQKPVSYYQRLAEDLGVSQRCRWIEQYIPDHEIGDLFQAADLIVLTYRADFASGSGVLNLAVHNCRPCLASSGPSSNLRTVVQAYDLGIFVPPDSWECIRDGIQTFLRTPPTPQWQRYETEQSWERNAALVCDRLFREPEETP